jgi:glycosyltransferase involved in cell wall biosynthesis
VRVAIITGSYPPDVCGVSDYTEKLEQHLKEKGVDVQIYTGRDWSARSALRNVTELRKMTIDVIHMQYPTTGYGWSLGPQLMAVAQRMVLTVHEASQSHLLRRFSLYSFGLRAPSIIFTNEFEQEYAQRFAPWIKKRSVLIPIGSNIPVSNILDERPSCTVTYFGLIRPEKGLERVIELGKLLKHRADNWSLRIIGRLMPGHEGFYNNLRRKAEELKVDWHIDMAGDALSRLLASSDIAYLPFPDGASERRSSLIALLSNGAAVVTTKGTHTPSMMNDAVLFARSASEALKHIETLAANPALKAKLQRDAVLYSRKFKWEEIANQHIAVYRKFRNR